MNRFETGIEGRGGLLCEETPAAPDPVVGAEARRRRTFAIISHPDAGKTTLTEKLLLYGGAIDLAGIGPRPAEPAAPSPPTGWSWSAQRGISITSTVLSFDYRGRPHQPARHPRPPGLQRGHLPHADGRRLRRDGPRRGQGRRAADREALPGLPPPQASRSSPSSTRWTARAREPLELLTEIERVLGIGAAPLNWPIGDRPRLPRRLRSPHAAGPPLRPRPTHGSRVVPTTVAHLDDPDGDAPRRGGADRRCDRTWTCSTSPASRSTASGSCAGEVTPVFFGSALTNFGVEAFLDAFLELSPAAGPAPGRGRPGPARSRRVRGLRLQDPGEHGPAPPRPRRLPAGLLRPLRARHVRHQRPQRREDPPGAARTGSSPRAARPPTRPTRATSSAWPAAATSASATRSTPARRSATSPCPNSPPSASPGSSARIPAGASSSTAGSGSSSRRAPSVPSSTRARSSRELILAAVGQLQFDVVQARLKAEYGVTTRLQPLDFRMALRVEGEPDAHAEDVALPDRRADPRPRRPDGRALQRALRTRELPQE